MTGFESWSEKLKKMGAFLRFCDEVFTVRLYRALISAQILIEHMFSDEINQKLGLRKTHDE